jgi:hypothetical protein
VAASAAEANNGDQDVSSGYDLGDPDLATRGQSAEIVPLIKSVIEVTQRQADSLLNLPRVASGEVTE